MLVLLYINLQFSAKIIVSDVIPLPAFIQKLANVCVSSDFYEKYIGTIVPWKTVNSINFCFVHFSVKFYNDWVNVVSHIILSVVFTLCTNTNFNGKLFHQLAKFSINLIALLITTCKEQKNAKFCNEKTVAQQNSSVLIHLQTRNWLPNELLVQHLWKKFLSTKSKVVVN